MGVEAELLVGKEMEWEVFLQGRLMIKVFLLEDKDAMEDAGKRKELLTVIQPLQHVASIQQAPAQVVSVWVAAIPAGEAQLALSFFDEAGEQDADSSSSRLSSSSSSSSPPPSLDSRKDPPSSPRPSTSSSARAPSPLRSSTVLSSSSLLSSSSSSSSSSEVSTSIHVRMLPADPQLVQDPHARTQTSLPRSSSGPIRPSVGVLTLEEEV
eukprot:766924-Hanusia_phi.AAC.1